MLIFFFGAIIGSFLNVVIIRLPHGGSLKDPKRSCCPACHRPLPWWENIPIISWLLLRGCCSGCHGHISIQYPLVEVSTGLLFWFCYHFFPWPMAVAYALLVSLLLVATVIDLQYWIIPNEITIGGIIAGVAASALIPEMMETTSRGKAAFFSATTAAAGYGLLWGILELGKWAFGKKKIFFSEPIRLRLSRSKQSLEPIFKVTAADHESSFLLHLGEETIVLEELLLRPSDRIVAHANWMEVAGQRFINQHFYLQHQALHIHEDSWPLEIMIPFQAEITEIILPREAMGFGDVKLLGSIGAFLGWKGMLFALFGGSILGSIVALFLLLITHGRVGKAIPFGPALAAAAALWLFRATIGVP